MVPYLALAPYALLAILFVASLFRAGSLVGMFHHYARLTSKLEYLNAVLEPQAWQDAATQVLFSYGVSLGAMTALGSYTAKGDNFHR